MKVILLFWLIPWLHCYVTALPVVVVVAGLWGGKKASVSRWRTTEGVLATGGDCTVLWVHEDKLRAEAQPSLTLDLRLHPEPE